MREPLLSTPPDQGAGRWRPVLWGLLAAIAVLPLVALPVFLPESPPASNTAGMAASFVLLWLFAGILFLRAAR